MDTHQLSLVCERLDPAIKHFFRGVFSLDNFILDGSNYVDSSSNNILIFNNRIAASRLKGHWLLMCLNSKTLSLFDSFNKEISFYGNKLDEYILGLSSGVTLETTPFRVQGNSKLCGVYCIFVAHHLAKGSRLPQLIQEHFSSSNLAENDNKVLTWFVQQPYGYLVSERCKEKDSDCVTFEELGVVNDGSR